MDMNNVLPGSEDAQPVPGATHIDNIPGFFNVAADIPDRTPDIIVQTLGVQPVYVDRDAAVGRRINAYQSDLYTIRPFTHAISRLYRQHSPEFIQGLDDDDTLRVLQLDEDIIVPAGRDIP